MRKLNFLKAIIDLLWIMSLFTFPFILLFCGYLMFTNEVIDIPITLNGVAISVIDLNTKILLITLLIASGLLLYSVYLFKSVLRYFQTRKIFDNLVITHLHKIGVSLSISAVLFGIPSFIINFLNGKATLEIGLNSFVLLFALGLFFMVLSEVFKMAKFMKEENELTV